MPAIPEPAGAVKCPDCQQTIRSDLTQHALSCASVEARAGRTKLHTVMEVAHRVVSRELDPDVVVTGCKDAYPSDYGFETTPAHPEAVNHRADACVYDPTSNERALIDFTFTNAAKSSGTNGAKAGGHADKEQEDKERQYGGQFVGFGPASKPALVILSMERHGSWGQSTIDYWDDRVQAAHDREVANMEFPTPMPVLIRRVRQTMAIALWRSNAGYIASFYRRALLGARRVGDSQ